MKCCRILKMLLFLQGIFLFYVVLCVSGGSMCPQRSDVYPCICINRPIGKKKMETTLICHNLQDASSVLSIEPALNNLEIDKLLLYDSFWEQSTTTSKISVSIFNKFKIKEIEIVDTKMDSFACPLEMPCGLSFLKRLSSVNSTMNDESSCSSGGLTVNSWVSCPENIEFLSISFLEIDREPHQTNSEIMNLRPGFFPQPLSKLKELHLSHNRISRIDSKTFTSIKFPILETLNLSHNSLRDVRRIFSSPMKIKNLDLSHSNLRAVFENFAFLPFLETLNLAHTYIQVLSEKDWKSVPATIKHIDFSGNLIKCGCSELQWFNSTFPINTAILGTCSSPSEVQGMPLRRASRALIERCDEKGMIGSRKKKKKQR